jgi:hypothetical protein
VREKRGQESGMGSEEREEIGGCKNVCEGDVVVWYQGVVSRRERRREMKLRTWIGASVGAHGGDERSKTRKLFGCRPWGE